MACFLQQVGPTASSPLEEYGVWGFMLLMVIAGLIYMGKAYQRSMDRAIERAEAQVANEATRSEAQTRASVEQTQATRELAKAITDLQQAFRDLYPRLDRVDGHLDRIDGRLDRIEGQLERRHP